MSGGLEQCSDISLFSAQTHKRTSTHRKKKK